MTIIQIGDRKVANILQSKLLPDREYHLSPYVFALRERERCLIKNTVTGTVAALSNGEWEQIEGRMGAKVG